VGVGGNEQLCEEVLFEDTPIEALYEKGGMKYHRFRECDQLPWLDIYYQHHQKHILLTV
jgi:hypothetical protein